MFAIFRSDHWVRLIMLEDLLNSFAISFKNNCEKVVLHTIFQIQPSRIVFCLNFIKICFCLDFQNSGSSLVKFCTNFKANFRCVNVVHDPHNWYIVFNHYYFVEKLYFFQMAFDYDDLSKDYYAILEIRNSRAKNSRFDPF